MNERELVMFDLRRPGFISEPTPADLLTDPRVEALVAALRSEVGALRVREEFGGHGPSAASVAALAPFDAPELAPMSVPWERAGGPDECEHGYAAGVPCPTCIPPVKRNCWTCTFMTNGGSGCRSGSLYIGRWVDETHAKNDDGHPLPCPKAAPGPCPGWALIGGPR